jgi:hypothetical protein
LVATASHERQEMTQDEKLISASMPVVQAFSYFYETQGPDLADGLIAGLILYKAQLDKEGEPIQ